MLWSRIVQSSVETIHKKFMLHSIGWILQGVLQEIINIVLMPPHGALLICWQFRLHSNIFDNDRCCETHSFLSSQFGFDDGRARCSAHGWLSWMGFSTRTSINDGRFHGLRFLLWKWEIGHNVRRDPPRTKTDHINLVYQDRFDEWETTFSHLFCSEVRRSRYIRTESWIVILSCCSARGDCYSGLGVPGIL